MSKVRELRKKRDELMEKYRNRLRLHVIFIGRVVREGDDDEDVKKGEIGKETIEERKEKEEEDKENIVQAGTIGKKEDEKKMKKEVEEEKYKEAKRMELQEKENNKKIREKKILEEMKRKIESKFLVSVFGLGSLFSYDF